LFSRLVGEVTRAKPPPSFCSGDGDESSADVPARFDMVDLLGELFEPSGLVELRRRSAGLTHMLPRRLSDRPRSSLEAVEADVVVVVNKLARRFRSLTASTDEPRLDCCWLDCWLAFSISLIAVSMFSCAGEDVVAGEPLRPLEGEGPRCPPFGGDLERSLVSAALARRIAGAWCVTATLLLRLLAGLVPCCIFLSASTTFLLVGEVGEAAGAAGVSSVVIVTLFAIAVASFKSIDHRLRSFALSGEPSGGDSEAEAKLGSGGRSNSSVGGLAVAGEFESGGVANRGIFLTPSVPCSFILAA